MEHIVETGTGFVHVLGFGHHRESEGIYGHSKFEGGEVAALRNVFISNAQGGVAGELKLETGDIIGILKDVIGYSKYSKKELNYVLDKARSIKQG